MKRIARRLRGEARGAAAIEFVIVAPVALLLVIGIARLGILFMANAGLRSAVTEGARYATIYPRPTDDQIRQRIADRSFGMQSQYLGAPTIVHGTANGAAYEDISMSYSVPMDFVFFHLPNVTLTATRRVFVQSASSG